MPHAERREERSLDVRITVDAEAREAVIIASLSGVLSIGTAEMLEHALRRAESIGPDVLVVDLRGLEALDSVGLLALLGAHGRIRRLGCRVLFLRGSREVQRLFRRVGLEDLLEFREVPGSGDPQTDPSADQVRRWVGS